MKTKIIAFIFILVLPFSVIADKKRDLVLKMLEVTEAKKNHDVMIKSYIDSFSKDPVMDTDEFKLYFKEALSWDSLIEPIILIYSETYTNEELRAVNSFYGSEIGKSFIKKMPEITTKSSVVIMDNIKKALSHLKK